jgi:hypothetical protein
MNRAGYDLLKEHNWQALELEYRFYTTAITTTCDTINNTYDLLNVADTTGLDNTYSIVGTAIPQDTYVNSVTGSTVTTTQLASATSVGGAEGGNAINVAIQLKDANGADLAVRGNVYGYLSDDANGDSLIGTATSGTVVIGTDGVMQVMEAKKSFRLTSESDGDIDITITEAGVKTLYLILVMPNGKLVASGAITFA